MFEYTLFTPKGKIFKKSKYIPKYKIKDKTVVYRDDFNIHKHDPGRLYKLWESGCL